MTKLSMAVLIAGLFAGLGLAGCGGGGGGNANRGGGGGTTGTTIVSGTVLDDRSPAHAVANVAITLGTAGTTVTNASGKFSFNLGTASVASLFSDPTQAYFKVSTYLLPSDQYPQVNVTYLGVGYEQIAENGGASIPLPFEVYAAQGVTKDLGVITVKYNDPNNPPPFPY
jgi:hypothetical protein